MFGLWELDAAISIFFVTYFVKAILSICDTPFVYLLKKVKPLDL